MENVREQYRARLKEAVPSAELTRRPSAIVGCSAQSLLLTYFLVNGAI
jgi:hypothetical protein